MERKVIVYSKKDCGLCEKAKSILEELQKEYPFALEEVDIYEDEALLEKYQLLIPVITINSEEIGSGIILKNDIRRQILRIFQ